MPPSHERLFLKPHLILELCLSQHHRRVIGKAGRIDCCCRRRSRQPPCPLISCVAPLLSSSCSRIHREFMSTSSQELRRIPGLVHVADSRSQPADATNHQSPMPLDVSSRRERQSAQAILSSTTDGLLGALSDENMVEYIVKKRFYFMNVDNDVVTTKPKKRFTISNRIQYSSGYQIH